MKKTTLYAVVAGAAFACLVSTSAAGMLINNQMLEDSLEQPQTTSATSDQGTPVSNVVTDMVESIAPLEIPVPASIWLFGSGLLGLISFARKRRQ